MSVLGHYLAQMIISSFKHISPILTGAVPRSNWDKLPLSLFVLISSKGPIIELPPWFKLLMWFSTKKNRVPYSIRINAICFKLIRPQNPFPFIIIQYWCSLAIINVAVILLWWFCFSFRAFLKAQHSVFLSAFWTVRRHTVIFISSFEVWPFQ